MKLTSEQTTELAKSFSIIALLVAEYRLNTWERLTKDQRQHLSDLHRTLINYSDNYITLSGTLLLENAETDLQSLNDIVKKIEFTVKKLENLQTVINMIGTVLELGAAIAAKDPGLIASKIQKVFTDLKGK